jgi:hypothetical protein
MLDNIGSDRFDKVMDIIRTDEIEKNIIAVMID